MNFDDKRHIVEVLKRLDIYIGNNETKFIQYLKETGQLQKYQILYYAIKEIHLSPHKAILDKLTREKLIRIYLSTEKYVCEKEDYTMLDILKYFIKSIKNEAEEVFEYAV